jgi:hypothetical protein
MIDLGVVDYRDEYFLKTFRRWYVIKSLTRNIKFRDGIPLEKAALVDFLLCNPPVLQKLLVSFGKAEPVLNLDELLYRNNLEFGEGAETEDFSATCVLLISRGYISFAKIDGEIYLQSDSEELSLENPLAIRWGKEISLLQPLLSKSKNVLFKAIYGEANGN